MIVIGRMHIGAVLPEWLTAWEQLQKPTKPDGAPDYAIFSVARQVVHAARNDIVRGMLAQFPDATHLFFIDDDVTIPPDGLLRLLAHDLPVVSGLYIQRGEPHLPVAYHRASDGHYVHAIRFCDGLNAVDAVGAGCLLIRADVLRAIAETGESWFDWSRGVSEDMAFCQRAQALGFSVALDFDVKCGHLTTTEVTYDSYLQYHAQGVTFASEDIAALAMEVRPWPSANPPVEPQIEPQEATPDVHLIQGHHPTNRSGRAVHRDAGQTLAARGLGR